MGNYLHDNSGIPDAITVDEFKAHNNITHSEDDDTLAIVVSSVTDYLQRFTRRAFKTQTLTYYTEELEEFISLPLTPVASVASVEYYDSNGDLQTLVADEDYKVLTGIEPSQIKILNKKAVENRPDAVRITYTAGTAETGKRFKTALFMLANHLYENKGLVSYSAQTFEIPRTMYLFFDTLRVRYLK